MLPVQPLVVFVACVAAQDAAQGQAEATAVAEEPASAASAAAYAVVCDWLREQTERLADDLESARQALLDRAREHDPSLLERLSQPVPKRRPGWGVLPEIVANGPLRSVEPTERRYALEVISRNFVTAFRDGRLLAGYTASADEAPLEPAVRRYERLRKDLVNVEQHLAYHEQWQQAAVEQGDFFAERNGIVAQVRELQALRKDGGDAERIEGLEREVRAAVAPFKAAPGLRVEAAEDGALVLPVTVVTDIADEAVVAALRAAVQTEWNDAAAARERRFSIALDVVSVSPDELYPEGPPARGEEIVVADHVARFPAGALVMTTGAASTHAWAGRSLILGHQPLSSRTLAHEFGHLLGFSDSYLRGYDGELGAPYGVVFVEWTGLVDDLMGNAGGGRVTAALVDQLIEAYGPD